MQAISKREPFLQSKSQHFPEKMQRVLEFRYAEAGQKGDGGTASGAVVTSNQDEPAAKAIQVEPFVKAVFVRLANSTFRARPWGFDQALNRIFVG